MGTKVQIESCNPEYFSMRDLNEDSNSCSWPLFYGDRTFTNGHYSNGFLPRTAVDVYSGYDRDVVKRTMLEHEAIFKNQLYELHRLYRIQRDLMDEARRKESNRRGITVETSLSSSPLASPLLSHNAGSLKDLEVSEFRPSKVQRKMFDLHLPAVEYIDTEVGNEKSGHLANGNKNRDSEIDLISNNGGKRKSSLADLNEPVEVEDANTSSNYEIEQLELSTKSKSEFLGFVNSLNGPLRDSYLRNNNKNEQIQFSVSHPISAVTSDTPSQYRVDPYSDLSKSWSHSLSSWDKLNGGLNQKSMPVQVHPCLNSSLTFSRSSQSSTQSHRWTYNTCSTSNLLDKNGFYHGSSSGSEELQIRFPSAGYGYLNRSSGSNSISQNSAKLCKNTNPVELKPAKEVIDLEKNPDDNAVTFPWLQNCKNEPSFAGVDLNAELNSLNLSTDTREASKVPNQPILQNKKPASCANGTEAIESSSCRKILGFPIFEKPKIESSSLPSPSEVAEHKRINRVLDINLPCDQEVDDTAAHVSSVRHHIDLNSCITEDEAGLMPSITGSNRKAFLGIDLEAPAVPEEEEDIVTGQEFTELANAESSQEKDDECIKTAAEAIVAISLSARDIHQPEASEPDSLQWFADLVSSFGENKYTHDGYSSEDSFESMTLRLPETTEEDYMPKPLVPENLILPETTSPLLTTRPRRGNARRGRQRRDFQRDILPGLSSLSRHEVTEDLQAFGGMMKATGHQWHLRNSTRNGCGRGRRRSQVNGPSPLPPPLVEQLSHVEAGLEDRSLTGWGKTTRRPRRQRCPPGHPHVLPLA